jgi:hypothetical protein
MRLQSASEIKDKSKVQTVNSKIKKNSVNLNIEKKEKHIIEKHYQLRKQIQS